LKGKIKPPRLNGETRGVLATRTPHRPNPLGLSLCRVDSLQDRFLVLRGVDLVDGTPVLDIKPYVPFADSSPDARAPDWVAVRFPFV
jgi:tRNA (adenine37-N6)-methyltransferase